MAYAEDSYGTVIVSPTVSLYQIVVAAAAALLYLSTAGLLGLRLAGRQRWYRPGAIGLTAAAAVTLHTLLLTLIMFRSGGINLSFFNALSLTGWLAAVLLMLLMPVRPVAGLGVVLLPLSALSALLAALFPSEPLLSDSGQWPLQFHIVLSVLAYALLTLAALQALLLALVDRRLRGRRPGGIVRLLPPLTALEDLLFQLIGIGFVMLTMALLSGFFFLDDIFAQHLVHKTALSLVAWLLFGVLLWGRYHYGWRGRTAVRWTLASFTLLALSYFGSQLVLQLILDRR